jgi:hypothetical protein
MSSINRFVFANLAHRPVRIRTGARSCSGSYRRIALRMEEDEVVEVLSNGDEHAMQNSHRHRK